MSIEDTDKPKQEGKDQVTIIIRLTANGDLNVNGFPTNKILAYGIMALATKTIDNYFEQKQSLIKPASVVPIKPRDS